MVDIVWPDMFNNFVFLAMDGGGGERDGIIYWYLTSKQGRLDEHHKFGNVIFLGIFIQYYLHSVWYSTHTRRISMLVALGMFTLLLPCAFVIQSTWEKKIMNNPHQRGSWFDLWKVYSNAAITRQAILAQLRNTLEIASNELMSLVRWFAERGFFVCFSKHIRHVVGEVCWKKEGEHCWNPLLIAPSLTGF